MSHQELYSFHVFLFPFQWYYTGKGTEEKTFEEKTHLKSFMEQLNGTPWVRRKLNYSQKLQYNEANYFHDFVRDILYDTGESPEKGFIANFEYDIPAEQWTYRIDVSGAKEYILNIDSILLHLYNNGVGVMSFHLNNRLEDQSKPQDILNINQFGRRLYPPFFAMEPETIGTPSQYHPGGFEQGLSKVKGIELADSISIGPGELSDDFGRYNFEENFKELPFVIPRFISGLFPGINLTNLTDSCESGIHLSPILDDRMFVVCWYGNDKLARELQTWTENKKQCPEGDYAYKWNEWWFKFLYVDGGLNVCRQTKVDLLLDSVFDFTKLNYYFIFQVIGVNFCKKYLFFLLLKVICLIRSLSLSIASPLP